MADRPNVLFLLSDQQRADTLGVQNPAIQTPHLDRLADAGTIFNRAYPPTPVCLPCRGALISGQYPSSNRAMHNHAPLRKEAFPTLPGLLSATGYRTHMIGKSHLNSCHTPGSPEAHPRIHDRAFWRQWQGPWYGFEQATLSIGHSTEKHACGMHYGVFLEENGIDPKDFFGHTPYEGYGAWDLPEEVHSSKWMADVAIDSIEKSRQDQRPFFLTVNFQDPHNPCYVPEPWASMYDPEKIPRFGFKEGEPASFETKPAFYREILQTSGPYAGQFSDPAISGAWNASHFDWEPRQIQENAAHYYGMISLMDKHIGRILDALDASGQRENTIVVFASDHGDFLGDHGLWWKEIFAFEEGTRVPMIVSWPGRIPSGAQSAALQNLVDLPTTFLTAATGRSHPYFEGVNQLPCWTGEVEKVRSQTVVEARTHDGPFNQRMLITDTHKLAVYAPHGEGELYDVEADPDHLTNLFDDPAHATLRHELMTRLLVEEMNRRHPEPNTYPLD